MLTIPSLLRSSITDRQRDRINSRIGLGAHPNGCREWVGRIRPNGYGTITIGSKPNGTARHCTAHRAVWCLNHGDIPNGMVIMHSCDNPRCVNIEHLRLGTQLDNIRDMCDKGRTADVRGEKHPRASITNDVAVAICRLAALGNSNKSIAARFRVTQDMVSKIATGAAWSSATGLARSRRGPRKGEDNGSAVIDSRTARRIVEMKRTGMRQREIARLLGVHEMTVSRVVLGKTWASVTGVRLDRSAGRSPSWNFKRTNALIEAVVGMRHMTHRAIASVVGVSQPTVSLIIREATT